MAATRRSSATTDPTSVFIPPTLVPQMAVVHKHRVKSKEVETQSLEGLILV